jgi:DNA-binding response OmpR family regulator
MTEGPARRVLVVDDEALIGMLVADMLEELGCEVLGPALDLDEALVLARESKPDWAILDLSMGGKPSYPVAQVLGDQNIPFVFASGYDAREVGGGFEGIPIIQKPFTFSEIAAALRRLDQN